MMENEIYLNIQNSNSTAQVVTLWQLPNSNDSQVYLQNLGAPSVPNPLVVLGDILYFNTNNNTYYTFDTGTFALRQYDSTLTTILNTYAVAPTYSNFYEFPQFNSLNNLTYVIGDILGSPRLLAFSQTGGAYVVNILLPYLVLFSAYDSINNIYFYSSNVSTPNDILIFDATTNLFTGSIVGSAGRQVACFDSVNKRLITNDLNTAYIYDVDPLSINYLTVIDTFSPVNGGTFSVNSIADIYQFYYNTNNNYLYSNLDIIGEIQVWDSNSYTLVTTIPNISYIAIYLDNNLNLLYGQNYVASTLDVIDCQTNTLISSEPATAPLGFYPVYNSSNGNIVLWQQLGANIAAQLTLPSVTFSTDGIPTYPQLVESMYGFNPYQFTKLYISTSTLSQINQPLTINYTFPDGRLNTDLRFPVISPLQRQFVISEFDLNMTANGQSNLQYTVLPNTDVTLIFTYKQPSSGENIEEVETLYEDVTEKFKQLEISRKNNPLTDMKWDI